MSLWIGTLASSLPQSNFESIATVTVGSGGASSIQFTNIPSTYQHLQLRTMLKDLLTTVNDYYNGIIRFNSDSGANYCRHYLLGNGSTVSAGSSVSATQAYGPVVINSGSAQGNCFSASIVDILDYTNTSKNKVIRSITGTNWNATNGDIRLGSSMWMSTNAITSITISSDSNQNFAQYSTVALYGIK